MSERSALALAFALALAGSSALAAGWQTSGSGVRQEAQKPGEWRLSDTGALHWTTDGSGAAVPGSWYDQHSKQLEGIQREIDCQISACGQP
jgi:hypothetical protein